MAYVDHVGQDQLMIWAMAEARRRRSIESTPRPMGADDASLFEPSADRAGATGDGECSGGFVTEWQVTDQPTN
ncbi:MAG TPA: hypothetical protein VHS52_03295 [Acidimicrobiales bacterium]|jgi:hypothetical protein|nr:hypothetical protein [Acidimicrobiales bacterium]